MRRPSIVALWTRRCGPWSCLLCLMLSVCLTLPGRAAEETSGQEDLDRATLVKLSAKSMGDLETAIDLCESALKKGVDAGNESYAKELLTATLYENASHLSRLIFDQRPIDPRWPRVRQIALRDLERALEVDPEMGSTSCWSPDSRPCRAVTPSGPARRSRPPYACCRKTTSNFPPPCWCAVACPRTRTP